MAIFPQSQSNPPISDPSTPTTLQSGVRKPKSTSGTINELSPSFVRCGGGVFDDRLVVCAVGLQKTGKDHFSLTAPDPIFHQGIDPAGLDGVKEKFGHKEVYRNPNEYYIQLGADDAADAEKLSKAADLQWRQFVRDFYYGLDMLDRAKRDGGRIGTIVWSSENDVWELLRLARFGELNPKTGKDRGNVWGPVNAEYKRLLREPFHRGFNFILLDKMKDEYKDNQKTGHKQRAGFADVPSMAQVIVRTVRDGSKFSLIVEDCRHNPSLNGMPIPDNDFMMLKSMVLG